jgi:hypothetical protein
MRQIQLTITFTDDDGTVRHKCESIETCDPLDPAREHRLAHLLFSELKATVGKHAVQKHNAAAWGWLKFPNQPAGFEQFFDIHNSQAVWRELATLVMQAEGNLILAQAFKALEPPQEPSFDDTAALNDLYNVHRRKMTLLNQSVQELIKVQDLVNRLLHESLGGDLVDTSDTDWETQLTRKKVKKGLKAKLELGAISQSHFDAITQALGIPENTSKGQIALTYRNRLAHHIRPSVDYSMFFPALESRVGEEVKDTQGKVRAIRHVFGARPPIQYRFEELHAASSEYLDAIVAMLERLRKIDILCR